MRLIDADALMKKAYWKGEVPTQDNLYADGCEVVNASDVENAPTIEAEPVRHGRWEDRANPQWPAYDIRHCSVCGWNIHKTKLRNKDANWNYCPNCGAKMDLKEVDHD